MWLKKIKQKKIQYLIVGLMLCFAAAILSSSICFVIETSMFTNDYISYKNCPSIIALVDTSNVNTNEFNNNDNLMSKTSDIRYADATVLTYNFYFKDKKIQTFTNIVYQVKDIDSFIHNLKILDGDAKKSPATNEIWINSVCADSYDIKVGDKIRVGSDNKVTLLVSAIVASPICPSSYMGNLPFYINDETSKILNGTPIKAITLFAQDESINTDELKELLPDNIKKNAVNIIDSSDIKMSISYISDIFGGIGIIASIVIFIVSLIITKFIINSALEKEYRSIGTYKALGFTTNQIIGFYLKSFVFAGTIGVIIGASLSFPLAKFLCNSILKQLGVINLSNMSILIAALTAIFLIILLAVGIALPLNKIRAITPVEALNTSNASTKSKISKSLIKDAYTPLSTAINDIYRKKSSSILTIIVIVVSFYMSILFSTVGYSISKFSDNTGTWFAFPKYDAIITLHGEDCKDFLTNSKMIKSFVLSNNEVRMSGLSTSSNIDTNSTYIIAYNDCSEEKLQLPLLEGRHPASADEIIMSYTLMKEVGLKTGDWFSISNDKYSNDYLITGSYSSMFDGGKNFIMYSDEYSKFGNQAIYSEAYVILNDNVSYSKFSEEFSESYKDCGINQKPSFLDGSSNSLNKVGKPLTDIFTAIFATFSILNIINILMINNLENRRQYGVLKAMGFTNSYICLRSLLRIAILTIIAAIIAIILHMTCSQMVFFTFIKARGLIYNQNITFSVIGILCAAIMAITLMFSIPMRKVSPTCLMEE